MKQQILSHLPEAHPWSDRIRYFDVLDSTNTRAKQLAEEGAPHGTVVIADCQTAGRGRMGRSFHSPENGGIYLSVILRPECIPDRLMHLTCAAGTAMCDAIERVTGLRPGVKWINDLVINKKKLGGILTELFICPQTGNVRYSIVGIGINCCQELRHFPEELRQIATSLLIVTGKSFSRAEVAAAMIDSLFHMDRCLLSDRVRLMAAYRADCVTLGAEVAVISPTQTHHGLALDVAEDGGLLVRYSDGSAQKVQSGEVSVRGMYGYV